MKCVIGCGRQAGTNKNVCQDCHWRSMNSGMSQIEFGARRARHYERRSAAKTELLWRWANTRRASLIILGMQGKATPAEEKELKLLQRVATERTKLFDDAVLKNVKRIERRVKRRQKQMKKLLTEGDVALRRSRR